MIIIYTYLLKKNKHIYIVEVSFCFVFMYHRLFLFPGNLRLDWYILSYYNRVRLRTIKLYYCYRYFIVQTRYMYIIMRV